MSTDLYMLLSYTILVRQKERRNYCLGEINRLAERKKKKW